MDDTYIVSPIILDNKCNIMSIGLAVDNYKIKKIYNGFNPKKNGYMGRISIANNIFATEPLVFFTTTHRFIDEIGLNFHCKENWIKVAVKALNNNKYYCTTNNIKAYSSININWDDINVEIKNDPYFPIINYICK
jgi:hypothetical protein